MTTKTKVGHTKGPWIPIKFQGKSYLLIWDKEDGLPMSGAIATKEQYENFEISYAHLFSDGKIKRFNQVIGTIDDIQMPIKTEVSK